MTLNMCLCHWREGRTCSLDVNDLQFRREGRTHEEWIDEEQPMRQWWHAHKHKESHFRTKMSEYLTADVNALWELTGKVGDTMAEQGCDIRKQCALGRCATRIWKNTSTEEGGTSLFNQLRK